MWLINSCAINQCISIVKALPQQLPTFIHSLYIYDLGWSVNMYNLVLLCYLFIKPQLKVHKKSKGGYYKTNSIGSAETRIHVSFYPIVLKHTFVGRPTD